MWAKKISWLTGLSVHTLLKQKAHELEKQVCTICFLDHEQCVHFHIFIISGLNESKYTRRLRPGFRFSSNWILVNSLLGNFAYEKKKKQVTKLEWILCFLYYKRQKVHEKIKITDSCHYKCFFVLLNMGISETCTNLSS